MIGLYFSGTGNTKHCVVQFVQCFDENNTAVAIDDSHVKEYIAAHDFIVFGSPVYFSNLPKIVQDFLNGNKDLFRDKKVFVISTMGLFSGDGAGCSARLFKKGGAKIVGGLHLKMPDCIGDEKLLKKSLEENRAIIKKADEKISLSVRKLKDGNPTKEGLNFFCHMAGLFGQRLWFLSKTASYKNAPRIDRQKCIGCEHCAKLCPMGNIKMTEGKATTNDKCTMCYRCFSQCPTKALTILGKEVHEQCYFEKYR